MADTAQQRAILRSSKTARTVRAMFPEGTRVTMRPGEGVQGTVKRHVPGLNAQGGYFVVEWDHGTTGRHSAVSLFRVTD